jgi:hypothetical protein
MVEFSPKDIYIVTDHHKIKKLTTTKNQKDET